MIIRSKIWQEPNGGNSQPEEPKKEWRTCRGYAKMNYDAGEQAVFAALLLRF